jgi:hypothetical protein
VDGEEFGGMGMSKLPNPDEVRQRLRELSKKPKESKPTYDINQLHNDAINAFKSNQSEATKQLSNLIDDNLLIDSVPPQNIHIGWSTRYQSITFSLFDKDELKTFIVRSATHNGEAIKWKSYGIKSFILTRIDKDDEVIFVSSGIGEYLLLEAFGVSFIALQSDHNDRHITPSMIEATHGKIIVYLQDNDDSAKQLGQRLKALFCESYFVVIDFETVKDAFLPHGYDLRDFCNEIAKQYGERAKEVIYQMINKEIKEGGTNAEI